MSSMKFTSTLPSVSAGTAAQVMGNLGTGTLTPEQMWARWAGTASTATLTAAAEAKREPWSGILGTEWSPTEDGRILELNEIGHRDLPVPFRVQIQDDEGHKGAFNCGSIEEISRVPVEEFAKRDDADDFDLSDIREGAIVIFGEGTLDGSSYAQEAKRILGNGSGVSLDGLIFSGNLYDKEDLSKIDQDSADMGDLFEAVMQGDYLRGVSGDIAGVTVVDIPAFREAKVVVASAQLRFLSDHGEVITDGDGVVGYMFGRGLTASAAPVKPPMEWFSDPGLTELTPLTITPEGRVFGHLADWDGCHVGFQGICVPPFRSYSEYAYFNTGMIETVEGEEVPCGKIMFCMKGNGHAPADDYLAYEEVQRYYDDATKVGAFVRAGSDRFGTWLAGALRPGLTEIEVQHLRSHPPSGDWRPIKNGPSELVAAFSVPIGGFPIPRRALVASADGEITAIISAPLQIGEDMNWRKRKRKKIMLARRLEAAIGPRLGTRERIRQDLIAHKE